MKMKMEVDDDDYECADSTPLHAAALANASEAAEVLLKNGADVNAKATLHALFKNHVTPLLSAELLRRYGTD